MPLVDPIKRFLDNNYENTDERDDILKDIIHEYVFLDEVSDDFNEIKKCSILIYESTYFKQSGSFTIPSALIKELDNKKSNKTIFSNETLFISGVDSI